MLYYVMLYYIILCYVMLYYVMLYYIMLCYIMLRYVILYYVMLYYVMLCYIMLCYIIFYYIILRYVMLYYVTLCYVILYYDWDKIWEKTSDVSEEPARIPATSVLIYQTVPPVTKDSVQVTTTRNQVSRFLSNAVRFVRPYNTRNGNRLLE